MDAVMLARLQFAVTMCFHFIFPPITIGLAFMLCVTEWLGWRKKDIVCLRMAKLFGNLFGITFAVGIASGIVMLFQFGTNWANYSKFVANVFGAPLAAEAFFAFFLESTFMGLYLFGRGRVSKAAHWFSLLMVAVGASTLSAFFIIAANSWLQTPAGYVVQEGRAQLTSLTEAIFNPSTLPRYFHVVMASLIAGAFIYAGVGAWHVLQDRTSPVGRRSLRLGVAFGIVFACLEIWPLGHEHAEQVSRTQPEKFAAMEGIYTGQTHAPLVLFAIPSTASPGHPELKAKLEIPGLTSYLAFDSVNAYVRGLQEFSPEDWPPLTLTFLAFHAMTALGTLFVLLMVWSAYRLASGRIFDDRRLLKLLVLAIPLPVLCCEFGWIAAEVGRQPWLVYRVLRTVDGASPTVSAGEVGFSLALFGTLYALLFVAWLYLMIRHAREIPPMLTT